jgi:[protein-PII] uridylyltransferase
MNNNQKQLVDTLQKKREKLFQRFLKGRSASFLVENAGFLDSYFRRSFEASAVGLHLTEKRIPYAVIAQGGYGRQEQCMHSDVDLLVLFEKKVPSEAAELIQDLVYPLWDIGLEVGHATRSIQECIKLAKADVEVLTPLLDARFICGMSPLYSTLMDRVRTKVLSRQSEKIITQLIQGAMARHHYFGDSAYLLEPNLKEGQGGLRDYHTLMWIAKMKYGLRSTQDLEIQGILSHPECRALENALAYIWRVRNHLHHLTGRKCDQLHFEHQVLIPEALKIKETKNQTPVEQFLGTLHEKMETVKHMFLTFILEQGYRKKFFIKGKKAKESSVEGIVADKNMLSFASSEAIVQKPLLLIKIFEESSRLKIPLSAEGKRLVHEFLYLAGKRFLSSREAVKAFERCLTLTTHDFNVLNDMLSTGFLARLIPELKTIQNRIQYDEYHLFPVDRHSIKTVQTIKNFGGPEDNVKDPLCAELYQSLKNRKLLLWAALLHDIGKGQPGGNHSGKGALMARKILGRVGYTEAQIDTVAFLVKEHLFLMKTATRRDINDEATALMCARRIKDVDRLEMLYLLTVADAAATGPKAWNSWTLLLLRDLALKTLKILEKGELASREALQSVETKKEALIKSAQPREERRRTAELLPVLSPRYMLNCTVEEIKRHMALHTQLGKDRFAWQVTTGDIPDNRTVTICAKDAPGLFSKMAGAFTLCGFDILDAQAFTWRNNVVLDIFEIKVPSDYDREEARWKKAHKILSEALSGELSLHEEIFKWMDAYRQKKSQPKTRPHRVSIDNDLSDFLTVLEVHTYDFPGLLFLITDTLFRCKLDVWVAKIATKADQVVDVFYVRDVDGQKIDTPDLEEKLRTAILEILEKADTNRSKNRQIATPA